MGAEFFDVITVIVLFLACVGVHTAVWRPVAWLVRTLKAVVKPALVVTCRSTGTQTEPSDVPLPALARRLPDGVLVTPTGDCYHMDPRCPQCPVTTRFLYRRACSGCAR